MKTHRLAIATAEVVLMLPAALFMAALGVRNFGSLPFDPAGAAQRIVNWYAGRMWTLWLLLLALPFAALAIGCTALRGRNRERDDVQTRAPMLLTAAVTLTAGAVLVVVVLHMAAN